jgi:acetyl esterase/lipase
MIIYELFNRSFLSLNRTTLTSKTNKVAKILIYEMIEVDGFVLDERMTDECRAVVLDALKRNNHQITNLEETRRKRNEISAKRMADLTFDDLVLSEFSVANPTDGYNVQVTCYKPKAATANAPIVVFSHGGGWSVGSRASHHQSVALLASNSQAIWLSVEMRLCPEVKFPTNLNDCIAVVRHVHANKEQFSSESARLGVCGNSSGGHLSSLMSHSMPDLIDFQILIYGTFYLGKFFRYFSYLH